MKLEVDLKVLIIVGLLGIVVWQFVSKDYDGSIYKEQFLKLRGEQEAKFKSDSITLDNQYKAQLKSRDSLIGVSNSELLKQRKIANYYAKKYNEIQVVPIGVVDKQLDSLFSGLH